ncbi:MAG: polysaccharide deacetylase family protein [Anaerolineaceae bacterium]|nr:polysaccharide deacetylase family protein [Anaerolineaceae bacterium]
MCFQPRTSPSIKILLLLSLILLLVSLAACQNLGPTVTPTVNEAKSSTAQPTWQDTLMPSVQPSANLPDEAPSVSPFPSSSPSPSQTPDPDSVYYPAGRVSIPLLMYHNISDHGDNRYITTISSFRAEVETLYQNGNHTITVSQLADVIRNGGYLPLNPVVLTFDDGYLGVYENAFPILKEYGYVGVMYVITDTLGTDKAYGYVQNKELIELVKAGWEIGSHSISHSDLKLSKLGMRNEIVNSRETLETLLGIKVRSFAYPYGAANAWTRERIEEYGYDSAVGTDILITHSPKSLYYLSRREVPRSITQNDFLALLRPGKFEIAGFPLIKLTLTVIPTP